MFQVTVKGEIVRDEYSLGGFIKKKGKVYSFYGESYDDDYYDDDEYDDDDEKEEELTLIPGKLVEAEEPCDEGGQWFVLRYKAETLKEINKWMKLVIPANFILKGLEIKETKK